MISKYWPRNYIKKNYWYDKYWFGIIISRVIELIHRYYDVDVQKDTSIDV